MTSKWTYKAKEQQEMVEIKFLQLQAGLWEETVHTLLFYNHVFLNR